jgi:hypothetical protein
MKDMYKNIILKGLSVMLFTLMFSGFTFSQTEEVDSTYADSLIRRLQEFESFDVPSDFKNQYRNALRRVRRVYPLALEAARVIDSLDNELEDINKNRKQNKMMRKAHNSLKDDFKFLLRDLYVSEGIVLTKLIYRETGMTVTEIIAKYKSGMQASIYNGLAGFFEQDLDAVYYPNTEDFVIECVINDIKSGKVDFDPTFDILSKEEFKKEKKEYKKSKKQNKEKLKQLEEMARQKQIENEKLTNNNN